MAADDVKLRYVSLPITYDQALDGIAYDYGEEGVAKAMRVVFACASQQSRQPLHMIDVTGERGWSLLAQRCRFGSVEECMRFVQSMRSDGLCGIVKDGGREFLAVDVIEGSVQGYRKRSEICSKAARAT